MSGSNNNNGAVVRLVDLLAQELTLTELEMVKLLGLQHPGELDALRDKPSSAIPTAMLERLSILVAIHYALRVLLPEAGVPAIWLRAENKAPLFAGTPAIDIMLAGLEGMRSVRAYLEAQLYCY